MIGSDYDDILTGSVDDNIIMGQAGNDIIQGGQGDDIISGGDGTDFASYSLSDTPVICRSEYYLGTGNRGFHRVDEIAGIEGIIGSDHIRCADR